MIRTANLLGMTLALAAGLAVRAPSARADASSVMSSLLATAPLSDACGAEGQAVFSTRERLSRVRIPDTGRLILVNAASQMLVAYQDGRPVLESRVVVGAASTPTPMMSTQIEFVRYNPTWTVPFSILGEQEMKDLVADPAEMARQGYTRSGGTIVQAPGDDNALGLIKFGLRGGGTIYLHDTNAPEGFDQESRDLSHGCVRVQDAFGLAAWIMGTQPAAVHAAQLRGDMQNHRDFAKVAVIIGYFTAWPDADGTLRYYPDIYGKDAAAPSCGQIKQEN